MSPEFSVRRTSASPAIWPILAWRWQCVIDLDDLTEKYETVSSPKVLPFFPSLSHHSSNLSFFAVGLLIVFYALLISLKKKNLPAVILNLLYCGFRFLSDQRSLPVLWHQSLLTFVQRWVMLLNGQGQNSARQFATLEIAYVAGTKRVGEGEKLENGERESIPLTFSLTPYLLPLSIPVAQDTFETKLSSFELKITAEYKH